MKKQWIWAAFFLLSCMSEAKGWSYGKFVSCNAMNPMPTIILKTSYGKLVHDFNRTTQELTSGRDNLEKGWFVHGLATKKLRSYIAVKKATVKKLDDTATCILPAEVEVYIGYKEPEIFVSKDLDIKSCRFSVVIRHEQVHQRINKLVLDHFLPLFFEELKLAVKDVKAIKVSDPAQGQEGIQKLIGYYYKRLEPVFNMYAEILDNEQSKLDNLTNYQMEANLCRKYDKEHQTQIAEESLEKEQ